MPPRVVLAVAADGDPLRSLPQMADALHCCLHIVLVADDSHLVLHHFLQVLLNLKRVLGTARVDAAVECLKRSARDTGSVISRDLATRILLGEASSVLAGALAEHEQVGEGVATQAIGPVQARGALSGCEEPGNVCHLRVRVNAHTAHHVVSGRADLHRLLGNVDVGEFFELVVHAGQLALDVFRSTGKFLLDPRNVQEDTAMRASPPFLDFPHDAARHVVTGQQFRGPPCILVTLGVPPTFLLVVGRLVAVCRRDVAEHETLAQRVTQDAALAPHSFGHQDARNARRPDHARRVELDEFHVD